VGIASAALLLCLGWSLGAAGADFQVRSWHVDEGLPDGTVTALAQTPDGYLWAGSRKGLVRFDGVRFAPVGAADTNGLPDRRILGLLAARDGSLWIASESGVVAQFSGGRFRVRFAPASGAVAHALPGSDEPRWFAFSPLAMDGEGVVWSRHDTNSLLRFAGSGPPTLVALDGLPEGPVRGLWGDHAGNVWLIKGAHACVFREGRWAAAPLGGEVPGDAAVASPAPREGMWFAYAGSGLAENFLRQRTAERWVSAPIEFPLEPGADRAAVSAVLADAQGRLWASSWWGGVHVREADGAWQRVQAQGPLAKCVVTRLFEDRQGVVWAGTVGEGLHQVTAQPASAVRLPPEAANAFVTTVHAAHDGALWLGTGGKGLFRWQAGSFTRFGTADGLPSDHISTVYEDPRTNLWVGTAAGLAMHDGARFVPVPGLDASVLALHNDRAGNLWVGSSGGLLRCEGRTNFTLLRHPGGGFFSIRCLSEDRAGRMWLAVFGSGVWQVQGEQVVHSGLEAQFHRADARSLLWDAEDILWIGTLYGGLFRWDGARMQHYSMADGLPSDSIISLTDDGEGNLWVSSDNGIFGCSRRSLADYERGKTPSLLCWRLGPADGLANRGCSGGGQPVASRAPDGRIWVANMVGAAGFDPRTVTRGHAMPKPFTEAVTADGVELPASETGFQAPTSVRRFDFRYTAPDLAAAHSLRFRYKLEELDRDWVDAGSARSAPYSKLPPGDYRFRVMVGGSDGQWRESSQAIALRVVPRFWEHRWVQVLAGAALISAVGAAFAWNQRRKLQLRLERLEMQHAVEQERTRIARDIHDDLGTSLTEIAFMSDPEHIELAEPDRVKPHLERISGKARAVVQALNEIVWAVNPRNDNLPKLLDYLCTFSEEVCESAGVRCWHEVPTGLPELPLPVDFRHGLLLAVKEALNNALRHSGAKEIWLRVAVEPGALSIVVEDNGQGFDLARDSSAGNGLRNMQDRMKELGGKAAVASAKASGTKVTFVAPLVPARAES
jgi:signal transduction histidine kinase/ligand-binding sensor domain-containing protein